VSGRRPSPDERATFAAIRRNEAMALALEGLATGPDGEFWRSQAGNAWPLEGVADNCRLLAEIKRELLRQEGWSDADLTAAEAATPTPDLTL
jgi:hypothetical protein